MATPLILSGYVLQGALSPEALKINVIPSTAVPDLSGVSLADFEVHYPDKSIAVWTCALSNKTATTLMLTHPYVASDTALPYSLHIIARLTIPAGVIRMKPCILAIIKP